MTVIKRYPNRKLYDTEAKRYITLEGIATLIRQGADVQVIDHTTEEDLTAVTLTQIILEQEKKSSGFLPKSVLTSLVQAGGDTMSGLRRNLTNSLGLFRQVDEEIERRLQHLVSRGELAREESKRLAEKLLGHRFGLSERDFESAVRSRGIPSRDELEALNRKLDALLAKFEEIAEDRDAD